MNQNKANESQVCIFIWEILYLNKYSISYSVRENVSGDGKKAQ